MDNRIFAVADALISTDIRRIRKNLNLTQVEFAELVNVSKKTIERWESGENQIVGPIVTLVKLLNEYPQMLENLRIPNKKYPLRLKYMYHSELCTIIDVDERGRRIAVTNFTNHPILRAFGRAEMPTYEDYEAFLESRCFPRTRDKMKLVLQDLDLPFYDPLMIIEKTKGKMAEDDFWIEIER